MGKNKKRKLSQLIPDEIAHDGKPAHDVGIGSTLANLQASELHNQQPQDTAQDANYDEAGEWIVVGRGGKKRKTNNYPALVYNELHKQQSSIKIQDLQTIILYCIADGPSPQWVSIRHHFGVKKAVVLFVPGLERRMFDGSVRLGTAGNSDQDPELSNATSSPVKEEVIQNVPSSIAVQPSNGISRTFASPDDYLPVRLAAEDLPQPLQSLADCFEHLWPVKAPGDDRPSKVYSPLHAMLNAHIPKSHEQKEAEKAMKGAKPVNGQHWQNKRTPITKFITTKEELQENDYVLHPVWFTTEAERAAEVKRREAATQTTERGWVDTQAANLEAGVVPDKDVEKGSLNAGRTILAMDCEMCKVDGDDAALTRISLVGWDSEVVMDELVKPDKPIVDYLTQFSGITAESLDPVTTTLADIQKRLLGILTSQTILVGHSLHFDLEALKLTHPFIIDTSILYQHPRGPPLKPSLKWLAQKYLAREIQKGHGSVGHNSIEDSRACLDLVKMKCEKGPEWGSSTTSQETIFKRLARTPLNGHSSLTEGNYGKIGAIIDHGAPEKNFGQIATYSIGCNTDAEVVEGVKRAVLGDPDGAVIPGGGVDFTWARMRELEALRGWSNNHRFDLIQMDESPTANGDAEPPPSELGKKVASTVSLVQEVHASLPPCTLLVVYSGTGDPRDLARLQKMQRTFKKEYKTKKWDQLSVKWTDTEEQALKQAYRKAREGLGFVTIT
ncbi:MAG: hypothetical protein Q9201_006905 [Fulgogasparrea decipioides]